MLVSLPTTAQRLSVLVQEQVQVSQKYRQTCVFDFRKIQHRGEKVDKMHIIQMESINKYVLKALPFNVDGTI